MMFRKFAIAMLSVSCGASVAAPDLVCGPLLDIVHYGEIDGIRAYSIGSTACNAGDVNLFIVDNSPNHPVISCTIYKLDDGRLIQLGANNVMHTFASLQGNDCGFGCGAGGTFSELGPGCSNPTGAGLSGSQNDLGPRSEVNAYSGELVYPYTTINQNGDGIYKRIQVPTSEIPDAAAIFFAEVQYVINDEVQSDGTPYLDLDTGRPTNYNNASYSLMGVQANGNAATTGATNIDRAAIYAWQDHGNGVNQPDNSVRIEEVIVPNEGLLQVASRVTDLGDGTWRYDYAVHNQNSDLNVGFFSVPNSGSASDFYFHDIDHHDGPDDLISGEDWNPIIGSGTVNWSCESFASNSNANAIRWGTMYNYSFVSDAFPVDGEVTLGMWKDPAIQLTANLRVPNGVGCRADLTGDGLLDSFDVSAFLKAFNAQGTTADFTGDGQFDFFDVSAFLIEFNAGCP